MHPYKMMLAQELSDFERNIPRSSDLFAWWHRLARPVTWFDPVSFFFLWGYLKAKVYARRPGTIEQLKEPIRQEVATIPPAMTRKAMDNFRERLQECVINNGRHLSDVIFKSVWKKMASYVLFINEIIFFLYLVSFGFYCPSKCGSYFCRTLYKTYHGPVPIRSLYLPSLDVSSPLCLYIQQDMS